MPEIVRRSRIVSFETALLERDEFVPMFRDLLEQEDFTDAVVLDLGTGTGRLALVIALRAGKVIGVDVDERAVSTARDQAALRKFPQAQFVVANVETVPWSDWHPAPYDFVTANFFMSEAVVAAAGRRLRPGGRFLFCCHHTDHWKETGKGSRWAFGEERMAELLSASGFDVTFLGVDTTVVAFGALNEVKRFLGERHVRKWAEDGRWDALTETFSAGTKHLTLAYLVGRAERPRR